MSKMSRKEAIEEMALGFLDPNMSKSSSFDEAMEVLLDTARQVEKVVEEVKGEIVYYQNSLRNENDKMRLRLKKIALGIYENIFTLLTKEE